MGHSFNRTKEWKVRRRGEEFQKYDYATRYELELQRLPAFADLSPEEYRQMVAEILSGSRRRPLSQDPCDRPWKTKKSPAPMLFFAKRPEIRKADADKYKDFVDEYELAAAHLIEAAPRGRHLKRGHLKRGAEPNR